MLLIKYNAVYIIIGTRPVNDPPQEQLYESETAGREEREESDGDSLAHVATGLEVRTKTGKQHQKRPPRKKPRLADALNQSNEQFQSLQQTLANNVVTPQMREKERQEDREFFKDIFADLSNTMIGMTQMLVQAHYAAPQQIPVFQPVHPANSQIPQCPVQGLQIPHTPRSSSPYSTNSGASDGELSSPHNVSCENLDMNHSVEH